MINIFRLFLRSHWSGWLALALVAALGAKWYACERCQDKLDACQNPINTDLGDELIEIREREHEADSESLDTNTDPCLDQPFSLSDDPEG